MLETDLEKIGLTPYEARIYDYLITNGDANATELSKKINIGRTNIYDYARTLISKGLLTSYEKRKKIYYHAEDPKLLKNFAEEKIKMNEEINSFVKLILPKLSEVYEKNSLLPRIENVYGEDAYDELQKRLYLLGAHHEIFYFIKNINQYSPPEPRYFQALFSRGIFTYLFTGKGLDVADFQKYDKKENRMTIQVDFDIDTDFVIFEDVLVIGDFRKNNYAATIIRSFQFVQTLVSIIKKIIADK